MKKFKKSMIGIACLAVLQLNTGCFGEFALVRKVYAFNEGMGDKFVKSIMFWVLNIIPVYGVASLIDVFFINVIEFWSGSNPVAMNAGDVEQQIVFHGGFAYQITATQNRFHVEQIAGPEKGKTMNLVFNTTEKTWTYEQGSVKMEVIKFNDSDSNVSFALANGNKLQLPL